MLEARDVVGHGSDQQDVSSFVEASVIFSVLLQADRGSFQEWMPPSYDLQIDTSNLVTSSSTLGALRREFQQKVMSEYDPAQNMALIKAPTGMGKTKLFLDLIQKHSGLEKVIYFSPLLALTDDFEDKLMKAIQRREEVLVYNHIFSGTLLEKEQKAESYELAPETWNFMNESFNAKLIVTTTQRLLLTLYSNSASDKLKLVSFKNSLLIVDEIQTLPKFLLSNFVNLLREICDKMNTRILFVSATVPHEMSEAKLPVYSMSNRAYNIYHEKTRKEVEFSNASSIPQELSEKKVLVMANTRRKVRRILDSFGRPEKPIYYLTSGVKKKTRAERLKEIKKSPECVVISTQVVEAGVDLDFSTVYREVAPLDSIVQVMGRLNREGNNPSATLHIFRIDGDHRPYSELEHRESLKVLQSVRTSKELYDKLDAYYSTISEENLTSKGYSNQLAFYEAKMSFDEVWEFVRKHAFDVQEEEPVLIPDSEQQLEMVRRDLFRLRKFDRARFTRYGELLANMPAGRRGLDEFFDQEILESKGILLPKKGKLSELYDNYVGLDKWLS